MIDTSSVCSRITKNLANKLPKSTPSARWINAIQDRYLKIFSNEPIKVLGIFWTTIIYNDWTCEDACLTVVEDGHKLIIGRDVFNSLELAVVQQQTKRSKCNNNIAKSTCKIKQTIASHFPHLVSRIGLSKTRLVKPKFHQKFTAKLQKSRRVQFNLQSRVTVELDRFQKEGHIGNYLAALTKTLYRQ